MGFMIFVSVGLISVGHLWFKMRDRQKQPQPFVVHLIDTLAMLAVVFGWILAAGLALLMISGQL